MAIDSEPPTAGPLSTEDALGRLDDGEFVELVRAFWERRRWTVEEVHDTGTWYVDLLLHDGWPIERRALARVKRPGSDRRVGGTEVRHFVRAVQGEEVDQGKLVVPGTIPRSARRYGAKFNVEVVGTAELAGQIEEWNDHDLLAERVGRPVAGGSGSLIESAPDPVAGVLEEFDVAGRLGRALDRHLPSDPTAEDVARLTFAGYRIAFPIAVAAFLLTVVTGSGTLLSMLALGVFLLVGYLVLLPLMAADIYVVRRFEATDWTPSWWSLASFPLPPVLAVVGAFYWYRRRTRTPSGREVAW